MSDSNVEVDLDAALGDEFLIVREKPQPAGFSTFVAKSKSSGSNVEIKTVPAVLFGAEAPVKETDLAARRIQHPNIVPLLVAGREGGTFFWISPEIDGRTLRTRLSRGGRLDVRDSLTVLRDVSAALTHAHLHGVVHGGLSPDSIVISGGSALLTDVGIPEVFAALRRARHADGARGGRETELLKYAAPEQTTGARADTRSDTYAWGVVAYELLAGRHPFAGRSTPREMAAAHSDEEPPPFGNGGLEIPASVTRLIMKCLAKNPVNRPETARDIFEVMTRQMLVPPPAPAAGTGQKVVLSLLVLALVGVLAIVWMGIR